MIDAHPLVGRFQFPGIVCRPQQRQTSNSVAAEKFKFVFPNFVIRLRIWIFVELKYLRIHLNCSLRVTNMWLLATLAISGMKLPDPAWEYFDNFWMLCMLWSGLNLDRVSWNLRKLIISLNPIKRFAQLRHFRNRDVVYSDILVSCSSPKVMHLSSTMHQRKGKKNHVTDIIFRSYTRQ